MKRRRPEDKRVHLRKTHSPLIISRFGRYIALTCVALIVVGWVGWQAWQLLGPPRLTVFAPNNGYVSQRPVVTLKGEVSSGASLSVNGSTIPVGIDGKFSTDVPLKPGVNRLTVHSVNRSGRARDIMRIVSYDLTTTDVK